MASIVNNNARYLQQSILRDEPFIYLESEGDKYIKELAFKQRDTDLSLEKHLQQEKEFEPAHDYLPVTEFSAGTSNLNEFILHTNRTETRLIGHKSDGNNTDVINNTPNVSRHIQDLALCVKPNSLETKLLQFAITSKKCNKKTDLRPADHPIKQLSTLYDSLFAHLSKPDPSVIANTITRKRRQLLESLSDPIGPKTKPKLIEEKSTSSLWDIDEFIIQKPNKKKSLKEGVTTAPKKKMYTLKNGVIVPVDPTTYPRLTENNVNGEPFIMLPCTSSANNANTSKYTIEEIKRLPHFANYKKGCPSRVLYLKNLSKSTTEEDLANLFQTFEKYNKPRLIYRLMHTGRMRGQAFVTFDKVEDAVAALEMLNGTIYKGKPIIIQFSNNTYIEKTSNNGNV